VTLQDALNHCRETGQPLSREILLTGENRLILDVNFAPIENLRGGDRKLIMVLHDVTPLRKLERVRADFVANVTHEIKTPLTAIIGFVQTLQEGASEEKATAARFLTIISEHALRLNRLVDDLLTLSSIELGEVKLHPARTDAGHAMQQALSVIEAKAQAKGLAIRQAWPDNLPPILADGDSVIQILVNVLDNAVKFTPAGSITIAAGEDTEGFLTVTIADTGIGIPGSEITRLGERFYRVDKMRSRELGGTGLGLSIVKHLLQAQQGRMEVASKPGQGTTVKLFFPLFPQQAERDGAKNFDLA
jgi:two-component system phosphate regulon sensor histidine kinase PhoR